MRNQKEKVNSVQNQLYPPPQKKKYVDTKGNKYFQVHVSHKYSTTMIWRGLTKPANDIVIAALRKLVEDHGGQLVGELKQIPGK